MKRVALISPYRGDTARNVAYARACMAHSLTLGEAPFAPHLLYAQPNILDDDIAEDRALGMSAGLAWGAICELVAVYIDRGMSAGMEQDVAEYRKLGKPVIFRSLNGWESDRLRAQGAQATKHDWGARGGSRMTLVLSLFPGIGLLDIAFEEEGFCVVRGPDLLWGGDIKNFHPPAGVFDGVIGGSPCQAFTRLVALVRHNGYTVAENLIPEFERVVAEAQPRWWVHENVRAAPIPDVPGYAVDPAIVNGRWLGEEQSREHRMSFGARLGGGVRARLDISPDCAALDNPRWAPRVLASGGTSGCLGPRKHRKKRTDLHGRLRSARYVEEAKRLQGLPPEWDLPGFTIPAKIRALGNAVPLPLGRAVARAVTRALEDKAERAG